MKDLISRQVVIDAIRKEYKGVHNANIDGDFLVDELEFIISKLPSEKPTLYGYNYHDLELIAIILQKENLPPERVVEALTDISRIVTVVFEEFQEALRKADEQ